MSSSMSHATASTPAPAILDTLLDHMAPLFLSGSRGDLPAARHAASGALAAYGAETEEELRLAAEVLSFSLHALESLGQAAAPDLPLTKVLRLRGGAVNLNRAAHRSQRKLDGVLRERRNAGPAEAAPEADATPPRSGYAAPAADAPPDDPAAEPGGGAAPALRAFTRDVPEAGGRNGDRSWTLAHQKRLASRRIIETFRRKQVEHDRQEAANAAPAPAAVAGTTTGEGAGQGRDHSAAAVAPALSGDGGAGRVLAAERDAGVRG